MKFISKNGEIFSTKKRKDERMSDHRELETNTAYLNAPDPIGN
jgi:hypothetical protein